LIFLISEQFAFLKKYFLKRREDKRKTKENQGIDILRCEEVNK